MRTHKSYTKPTFFFFLSSSFFPSSRASFRSRFLLVHVHALLSSFVGLCPVSAFSRVACGVVWNIVYMPGILRPLAPMLRHITDYSILPFLFSKKIPCHYHQPPFCLKYKLRRRQLCSTLMGVLLPLVLFIIISWVRTTINASFYDNTVYSGTQPSLPYPSPKKMFLRLFCEMGFPL